MVRVDVDARGAFRKLANARKAILSASRKTSKTLAKLGAAHAQATAPYFSGDTAKSVRAKSVQQDDRVSSWIIRAGPVHQDAADRLKVKNFIEFMHSEDPRAQEHFRSGDRKFMYSTREYLNRIKKGIARGNFRIINIGR